MRAGVYTAWLQQALSDVEPCFVLKVTKLTKIALIALRKKFTTAAAAAAAAANFFPKRYKGRRRCPLLLLLPRLLGVGRLAAATVRLSTDHGPTEFRTGSADDLYSLRDACPG